MASYDLEELFNRLAAMQKEAVSGCDAVPFWPYQQEALPYWWNRVNGLSVGTDWSEDIDEDSYEIEMGLVIAHLTEGYQGEAHGSGLRYLRQVLAYFDTHQDLNTNAGKYKTPYAWIVPGRGAQITGIPRGMTTVVPGGAGATQIYLGFILSVPLLREVY